MLKDYNQRDVDVFINYIDFLKKEKDKGGKVKNWWVTTIKDHEYAEIFKKSVQNGTPINGDSVTLTFRGKLLITYDYHAYKNKILLNYPETVFDFAVVYDTDKFNFQKKDGKVFYTHELTDPFQTNKKIIGAYGIIKNKRGEFIELLNISDIEKMKNASNMKYIWNTWLDRMVLKSVIKRICRVHFKDITKEMDEVDNQQSEPENALIDADLQEKIQNCTDLNGLTDIYNAYFSEVKDKNQFINLLGNRKKEINGNIS